METETKTLNPETKKTLIFHNISPELLIKRIEAGEAFMVETLYRTIEHISHYIEGPCQHFIEDSEIVSKLEQLAPQCIKGNEIPDLDSTYNILILVKMDSKIKILRLD